MPQPPNAPDLCNLRRQIDRCLSRKRKISGKRTATQQYYATVEALHHWAEAHKLPLSLVMLAVIERGLDVLSRKSPSGTVARRLKD